MNTEIDTWTGMNRRKRFCGNKNKKRMEYKMNDDECKRKARKQLKFRRSKFHVMTLPGIEIASW